MQKVFTCLFLVAVWSLSGFAQKPVTNRQRVLMQVIELCRELHYLDQPFVFFARDTVVQPVDQETRITCLGFATGTPYSLGESGQMSLYNGMGYAFSDAPTTPIVHAKLIERKCQKDLAVIDFGTSTGRIDNITFDGPAYHEVTPRAQFVLFRDKRGRITQLTEKDYHRKPGEQIMVKQFYEIQYDSNSRARHITKSDFVGKLNAKSEYEYDFEYKVYEKTIEYKEGTTSANVTLIWYLPKKAPKAKERIQYKELFKFERTGLTERVEGTDINRPGHETYRHITFDTANFILNDEYKLYGPGKSLWAESRKEYSYGNFHELATVTEKSYKEGKLNSKAATEYEFINKKTMEPIVPSFEMTKECRTDVSPRKVITRLYDAQDNAYKEMKFDNVGVRLFRTKDANGIWSAWQEAKFDQH